jgi:hypothetical protein
MTNRQRIVMSNHLPARTSGLLPSKLERQLAKALERIDAEAIVAMRRDEARLNRVSGTTKRGMLRAAELGAYEAALVQMSPNGAGYVHISAVAGAIGIAGVVHDAALGS